VDISSHFREFSNCEVKNLCVYLDAHAKREWQGGDDEKDGDESQQESATAWSFRIS